jgi:hypothetical protein
MQGRNPTRTLSVTELDGASGSQHLDGENLMPTLELNDVFEIPTERVARVGTNVITLLGSRIKKTSRADIMLTELHEISSMAFAFGARFAKRHSKVSELEVIWTRTFSICDAALKLARTLAKETKASVMIEDIERFRDAAQYRLKLYKKPA